MFVRQLIGRQADQIIEMPWAEAQANLSAGTVARVTDEEIEAAGHKVDDGNAEVPPEQLLVGYRIEPDVSGGFNLFDPGGVQINEEPFHNHIAARDGAIAYSRRARGLPDLFDASKQSHAGSGPAIPNYSDLTVEMLREEVEKRGIDHANARSKDDWIKLLEHDDKVKAALSARDFDKLTVADMKKVAADKGIDLGEARSKTEHVAVFEAKYQG